MPYQKSGVLRLLNLGRGEVRCKMQAKVDDWQWDDRSLHFHATWRQQSGYRRGRQ